MSQIKCKNIKCKNIVILYSSTNFDNPVDTKVVSKCCAKKYKLYVKFTSVIPTNIYCIPEQYFDAYLTLTVSFDPFGQSHVISDIAIRNICFKNADEVSASSQTVDYGYLYNVNCADVGVNGVNGVNTLNVLNQNNQEQTNLTQMSLSSLIELGIEKKIATSIKKFFTCNAFKVECINCKLVMTLDVTKKCSDFDTVKLIIKYKILCKEKHCPKPCNKPCDKPCDKPCNKHCVKPCDKPCVIQYPIVKSGFFTTISKYLKIIMYIGMVLALFFYSYKLFIGGKTSKIIQNIKKKINL